jgi:hypothetical protein
VSGSTSATWPNSLPWLLWTVMAQPSSRPPRKRIDRERHELDAGLAAAVGALALDDAAEDDAVVLLAVVVDDAGDDALVAVPESAGVVVLGLDDGFAGEELRGAVDACLGEDAGVAAGAEGVAAEQAGAGDGEQPRRLVGGEERSEALFGVGLPDAADADELAAGRIAERGPAALPPVVDEGEGAGGVGGEELDAAAGDVGGLAAHGGEAFAAAGAELLGVAGEHGGRSRQDRFPGVAGLDAIAAGELGGAGGGGAAGGEDVGEDLAGFDGGELIGIADQDEAGVVGQ